MNQIDPNLWVDSYGDSLYSYALFRVGNKLLAEELVQDTFVAALQLEHIRSLTREKSQTFPQQQLDDDVKAKMKKRLQ